MSRALVYDTLTTDPRMVALGFGPGNVEVNYDGDQRPSDNLFIIIGWEDDDEVLRGDDNRTRAFRNFTLYFHMYNKFSTDYNRIDSIITAVDEIFDEIIHVTGSDGYTVTLIETAGRSRDQKDEAYETICRSASYRILSREPASV